MEIEFDMVVVSPTSPFTPVKTGIEISAFKDAEIDWVYPFVKLSPSDVVIEVLNA